MRRTTLLRASGMSRLSLSRDFKFTVVAGLFTSFIVCIAFFWPNILIFKPSFKNLTAILIGIVQLCTWVAAVQVLAFCWATCVAYLARRYNWEPRNCIRAGNILGVVGLLPSLYGLLFGVARFSPANFGIFSCVLVMAGFYSGNLCKRLAYPDASGSTIFTPQETT